MQLINTWGCISSAKLETHGIRTGCWQCIKRWCQLDNRDVKCQVGLLSVCSQNISVLVPALSGDIYTNIFWLKLLVFGANFGWLKEQSKGKCHFAIGILDIWQDNTFEEFPYCNGANGSNMYAEGEKSWVNNQLLSLCRKCLKLTHSVGSPLKWKRMVITNKKMAHL